MRITDAEQVRQIVGDLDRLLVVVRDPALRRNDVDREQWQVLRLLSDGQGHPMGEISEAIGLAGATATRIVDSLAQRMQVYRRSDDLDRRRVLIYLAEPGRATLRAVDEDIGEHAELLLGEFEPAERGDLVRLLQRLLSATTDHPAQH